MSENKTPLTGSQGYSNPLVDKKVEDLLKPRYKVIADYPYSPYMIGSLVEDTLTRFLLTRTNCYDSFKMDIEEQDNYVPEETILKYPHLFKKLEWWEERKESDMPEYVKTNHGVYKVDKWEDNGCGETEFVCFFKEDVEGYKDWNPKQLFAQPATEQEYLNQSI